MATIDWVVGGAVTCVGLFLFYRALKEPADQLGHLIKVGLIGIKNMLVGSPEKIQEIKYG